MSELRLAFLSSAGRLLDSIVGTPKDIQQLQRVLGLWAIGDSGASATGRHQQ